MIPLPQSLSSESDDDTHMILERDALRAFNNKDEASFIDVLSKTTSLEMRDKGVMQAASVGWVEAVDKLLIRSPSSPKSPYFKVQRKRGRSSHSRSSIQAALLQAIKDKRYEIFMMLLPVTGADFCHNSFDNPLSYALRYCTEVHELKQFLRIILAKITSRTTPRDISHHLADLCRTGDTELIPEFFNKLFPKCEGKDELMRVERALRSAIHDGRDEVMECLIEQLNKFFPGYNNPTNLYSAVEARKLSILRYLVQHHHNSYTLKQYGEHDARMLNDFLKKANAQELYDQISRTN